VSVDISKKLDRLIMCQKCQTLHDKVDIPQGKSATCSNCGKILYHHDNHIVSRGLALSITGIILFFVANLFPLVKVELFGHIQHVTIVSMILSLLQNDFYIVGIVVSFLIFIFPLLILLIYFAFMLMILTNRGKEQTKELLILLYKLLPWSMVEIYVVSILVALVKLIGYMEIHFGLSFWALILFMILDVYLGKSLNIGELWELRRRRYHDRA